MADLLAFPADGLEARWVSTDGETESVTLRWENEAWTAAAHLSRQRVEYVVRLSPLWQVRQFLLFRDLDEPDLWLGTDGRARWGEMNGAHRTDLDGALDISVPAGTFTLALPIRRLGLPVGDAAEVTVLDVAVDTLGVVPVRVVYERLGDLRWAVERAGERVEFDVDARGLPHDVPERFRRLH